MGGRRRTVTPTLMQIKTLQYKNVEGLSTYKAMRKAGYSKDVAEHPKHNFWNKAGVKKLVSDINESAGITTDYLGEKLKEFLDAKKVVTSHTEPDKLIPDYDTQMKAWDRSKALFSEQLGGTAKGVKRKLTIEEFVSDDGVAE